MSFAFVLGFDNLVNRFCRPNITPITATGRLLVLSRLLRKSILIRRRSDTDMHLSPRVVLVLLKLKKVSIYGMVSSEALS